MIRPFVEHIGRRTVQGIEELGYVSALLVESFFWLFMGKRRSQPVKPSSIFREAMQIGVQAIPIVSMLCFSVGVMLAIQGIETLRTFGAESKVVIGIALSVTREFAPLIVAVLVAGRSGSAITARIGTMHESQEIDALRVIGISPIRYLATPLLIATLISVPALTVLGDFVGLYGGAVFTSMKLNITIHNYFLRCFEILRLEDIGQGLIKSVIFALIIVLIGISNGFMVRGGAEGVGRATTRSVVLSISFIILADMIFTFFMNR